MFQKLHLESRSAPQAGFYGREGIIRRYFPCHFAGRRCRPLNPTALVFRFLGASVINGSDK
jgi:hypothetical protein